MESDWMPIDTDKFLNQLRNAGLIRDTLKVFEVSQAYLFAKLYPRLYGDNLGHWHSPRQAAGFLTMALSTLTKLYAEGSPWQDVPTAYKLLQPVMWEMIRRRMPWLFLAPDLVTAIKRTDFPGEIDWGS